MEAAGLLPALVPFLTPSSFPSPSLLETKKGEVRQELRHHYHSDEQQQQQQQQQQLEKEMQAHALFSLYNLCRVHPLRQEQAALLNVLPPLLALSSLPPSSSPSSSSSIPPSSHHLLPSSSTSLRPLALSLLCDLAHTSPLTRREVWREGGVPFLLRLLLEEYWQVPALNAIAVCLTSELGGETIVPPPSLPPSLGGTGGAGAGGGGTTTTTTAAAAAAAAATTTDGNSNDSKEQEKIGTEEEDIMGGKEGGMESVEALLLLPPSLASLASMVSSAPAKTFEQLAGPLVEMLTKSARLRKALCLSRSKSSCALGASLPASSAEKKEAGTNQNTPSSLPPSSSSSSSSSFLPALLSKLASPKASVRKPVLVILRLLYVHAHDEKTQNYLIERHNLVSLMQRLVADTGHIIVRDLAGQLLKEFEKRQIKG
eukprot:evm.model.NODE_26452_length_18161_cov_25.339739.2